MCVHMHLCTEAAVLDWLLSHMAADFRSSARLTYKKNYPTWTCLLMMSPSRKSGRRRSWDPHLSIQSLLPTSGVSSCLSCPGKAQST